MPKKYEIELKIYFFIPNSKSNENNEKVQWSAYVENYAHKHCPMKLSSISNNLGANCLYI